MNNEAAVYIRVATSDITFVSKVMEGYEYLGVVTTLDRAAGLLIIRATPDTRPEVIEIIRNLPVPYTFVEQE